MYAHNDGGHMKPQGRPHKATTVVVCEVVTAKRLAVDLVGGALLVDTYQTFGQCL